MTEGFISFMLRIPSTNSLVVILCNASPTDFFGITRDLMKVLYNKSVHIKEPLQKVTERVLASKNAAAAVQEYRSLKNDTAKYYVDWISMNFLVEQLITLKRFEDARIIGELNAQEFPNHDLVFFTLGKAYEALNLKKEAITAYEKTLELFPNYEEAKNRLKALK
jgi:tetratricopeptide (TPR) repeat protein